jgi:hypothetical protein
MWGGLLWDVQTFSEVVLPLHEVGKALVRDVEEVDEGLDVAGLEQVATDALSTVILVVFGGCHTGSQVFALFIAIAAGHRVVLFGHLVEEDGGTGRLGRLLDRLDLLLFLTHLSYAILTPGFNSAFIGNSKLIAIIIAIKLTPPSLHSPFVLCQHPRRHYTAPDAGFICWREGLSL